MLFSLDWKISYAAIQGKSHIAHNVTCQDKVWIECDNGVNVVALSDGAGTAKLSHYGADMVNKSVSALILSSFNEMYSMDDIELKHFLAKTIRKTLNEASVKYECNIDDLSSTLLVVALYKRKYIAIHIGDGVIGCADSADINVLSKPENGELANETWFTTSSNLEEVIRIYKGKTNNIFGYILMSDGLEPSLYDTSNNKLAKAVIRLLDKNSNTDSDAMHDKLINLLEEKLSLRTNDDCSLVLISRKKIQKTDYTREYYLESKARYE